MQLDYDLTLKTIHGVLVFVVVVAIIASFGIALFNTIYSDASTSNSGMTGMEYFLAWIIGYALGAVTIGGTIAIFLLKGMT